MTGKPNRKLRSAAFRRETSRFDTGLKVTSRGCTSSHGSASCRCGYGSLGRLAQDKKAEPLVLADDFALAFEKFQDDWDISFDDFLESFDSSYDEDRRWKGDIWPEDPALEDNPFFEDIRDYPDEYELEDYYFERGWYSEDPEYVE